MCRPCCPKQMGQHQVYSVLQRSTAWATLQWGYILGKCVSRGHPWLYFGQVRVPWASMAIFWASACPVGIHGHPYGLKTMVGSASLIVSCRTCMPCGEPRRGAHKACSVPSSSSPGLGVRGVPGEAWGNGGLESRRPRRVCEHSEGLWGGLHARREDHAGALHRLQPAGCDVARQVRTMLLLLMMI